MGINETKLSNYSYSPNNGKDLKSNSLKIKKQEQKYNKKKYKTRKWHKHT